MRGGESVYKLYISIKTGSISLKRRALPNGPCILWTTDKVVSIGLRWQGASQFLSSREGIFAMKKKFVFFLIALEVIAVFGTIGVIEQTYLSPASASQSAGQDVVKLSYQSASDAPTAYPNSLTPTYSPTAMATATPTSTSSCQSSSSCPSAAECARTAQTTCAAACQSTSCQTSECVRTACETNVCGACPAATVSCPTVTSSQCTSCQTTSCPSTQSTACVTSSCPSTTASSASCPSMTSAQCTSCGTSSSGMSSSRMY